MLYTNHDTADRGGSGGGGRRGRVGIPLGGPPPFHAYSILCLCEFKKKSPKKEFDNMLLCCIFTCEDHLAFFDPTVEPLF